MPIEGDKGDKERVKFDFKIKVYLVIFAACKLSKLINFSFISF